MNWTYPLIATSPELAIDNGQDRDSPTAIGLKMGPTLGPIRDESMSLPIHES
jgi:hypothetical protein